MSSRIRILPQILADKIAAGEVVERPASVVKELVENAIDAGAKNISVVVEGGGGRSIQVTDDGCGMTLEEVQLSVARHATSKLQTEADLFSIATLGFRGEALPSIAAVSRLTIESAAAGSEGGRISIVGGELKESRVCGTSIGTRIRVMNLFFNTPARLKFLKSENVERGQIENSVTHLALSHPEIAFTYTAEGKQKLNSPVAADSKIRLRDCLGKTFVEDAFEVAENHPELSIHGWVIHPRQTAGNRNHIYLFLNGRFLKDPVLQHGLIQGYGDFLMKGRYPKGVLYLSIPFDQVDVNVHPSKREVRFRKPQVIHQFLSQVVRKALQQSVYGNQNEIQGQVESSTFSTAAPFYPAQPAFAGSSRDQMFSSGGSWSGFQKKHGESMQPWKLPQISEKPVDSFKSLRVIGVLAHSFILCESPENKLVLIDQHAAHEWIGYAKLKHHYRESVQQLLVPMTWEATPKQAALLQEHLAILNESGIEIEAFGGETFVVKGVPSLVAEKKIPEILEAIVAELEESEVSTSLQKTKDHVLKTMACHSQVRAKDKLSKEELEYLLVEMEEYRATHCPHGRPTSVTVEPYQIESWFKRS